MSDEHAMAREGDQPDEEPPYRPEGRMQLIPTTPTATASPQSDVAVALTYIKKRYGAHGTRYVDYPEGGDVAETSS